MKIVSNFKGDAEWGVVPYMHKSLLAFNDDESDEVLMNGVEWIFYGVRVSLQEEQVTTILSIMIFLTMYIASALLLVGL